MLRRRRQEIGHSAHESGLVPGEIAADPAVSHQSSEQIVAKADRRGDRAAHLASDQARDFPWNGLPEVELEHVGMKHGMADFVFVSGWELLDFHLALLPRGGAKTQGGAIGSSFEHCTTASRKHILHPFDGGC